MKRVESNLVPAKIVPVNKATEDASLDKQPRNLWYAGKASEQYTVKELREIAAKRRIVLTGLSRKADIIKKIKAAQ